MQVSKTVQQNEKAALELLEKENIPLSVGYVSTSLGITWHTARSLLLRMSLDGKIKALETSRGILFLKSSA